jgi:hypothetical protein
VSADGIPEVFMLAVKLHERLGLPSLKEMGGRWEHIVDDDWFIAMNGTEEPIHVVPRGGRNVNGMNVDLPAFTLGAWINGWLAAMVDPGGGVCMGGPLGEGSSEDDLHAALTAAIERAAPQ